MNWITASVFFPLGRLVEDFIHVYMDRYMYPVQTDPQYLDGVLVTQSPVESDTHLSMIARDNEPLSRFRKASWFAGTLPPAPVYNPPLDPDESPGEGHTLIGHVLVAGWPETFLAEIASPPVEIAELFEGVQVL